MGLVVVVVHYSTYVHEAAYMYRLPEPTMV